MLESLEGDGSLSRAGINKRFQRVNSGEIFPVPHGILRRPARNVSPKNSPRTSGKRNGSLATAKGEFDMDRAPYIKILKRITGPDSQAVLDRFWEKVEKRGPDECWDWKASVTTTGYGRFKITSYVTACANRVALALSTGVEPDGMQALHSCDRPICCNPNHLRWGTVADNVRDKVDRGRARTGDQCGANNGAAKLSDDDLAKVVDGLKRGLNNTQIARELPIGHAMVSKIRRGHMWKPQAAALGWAPTPPFSRLGGPAS